MKNIYPIRLFSAWLIFSFFLIPKIGFSNSINGTWLNVDSDSKGLTKIVISDNSKLRLWVACASDECDLGEVKIWDGGKYFKALFEQQIAKRKMKIFQTDQSTLQVIVRTEYHDNRSTRMDNFYFKKVFSLDKEDGGSIIDFGSKKNENCTAIDHETAKVNIDGNDFELGFGGQIFTPFFGFGNKKDKSMLALKVIKSYEIEKSCSVNSMQYLLTGRGAPRGAMEGEDCVRFELNKLKIKRLNGNYKIVSNNVVLLDFARNESDAKLALKMMKKYGFRNLCYVSRANPTFMYFRR